jgi:hypothetical protein
MVKQAAKKTTAQKKTTKTKAKAKAKPASPAAKAKSSRMGAPAPAAKAAMDGLLGGHPELRAGAMFGCPGYFLGKKAVACVFESDVCLTLPVPEIDVLVTRPGFRRFAPMGRVMSGWVLVNRARLAEMADDRTLLEHAIEYARAKAAAPPKGKPRQRR